MREGLPDPKTQPLSPRTLQSVVMSMGIVKPSNRRNPGAHLWFLAPKQRSLDSLFSPTSGNPSHPPRPRTHTNTHTLWTPQSRGLRSRFISLGHSTPQHGPHGIHHYPCRPLLPINAREPMPPGGCQASTDPTCPADPPRTFSGWGLCFHPEHRKPVSSSVGSSEKVFWASAQAPY